MSNQSIQASFSLELWVLVQVISSSIWNDLHMVNILGVWFSDKTWVYIFPSAFTGKVFQQWRLLFPETGLRCDQHHTHTLYCFLLYTSSYFKDLKYQKNTFLFSFYGFLPLLSFFPFSIHWVFVCCRLQCCIGFIICKPFWAILLCSCLCVKEEGLREVGSALFLDLCEKYCGSTE